MKPFLLPTLFAGMLFSGVAAGADPPAAGKPGDAGKKCEVKEVRDVGYVEGDNSGSHKLDLFLPRDKKDYPVVVFVHGGAWTIGDKSCAGLYSAVGKCLAENGVGAVLPNYRLSPWVKHPEHVKDVARAFAWTHKNIGKYGGNPDNLFVGGHSAGGHLAALLATDEQYLKAEGLSRKDVRGVLAVSGVYRIPDKVEAKLIVDGTTLGKLPLNINPFDVAFPKDSEGRKDASPVCHVCAGLPPCLLVTADRDLPLLPDMADELAKALKDKKCEVRQMKVEGRTHMDVIFKAKTADDPVAKAMLEFVAKYSGQ